MWRRMERLISCGAAAIALIFAAQAAVAETGVPQGGSLEDLAFMVGCWEGELGNGSIIRETFTSPKGGAMLGTSHVVGEDQTRFFEFIQIRDGENGIYYQPHPQGKDAAAFPLVKVTADEAVFENETNEFPQRIVYRADGRDRLLARIEKLDGEGARTFPMTAAPCGGERHQKAIQ